MGTVNTDIPAPVIASLIDLTSLTGKESQSDVDALCDLATNQFAVAAVCVYPAWIEYCKRKLQNQSIPVATVVNFPNGDQNAAAVLMAAQAAVKAGAEEIDVVIPYREIKSGEVQRTYDLMKSLKGTT